MKSKSIEEILTNLGRNIINSIPEEWSRAQLDIRVLDKHTSYKGFYIKEDNSKVGLKVSKFTNDTHFDLKDLHKITTQEDRAKWNRAIFVITPDNKFDMEFKWDQELADEIERLSKGA